MESARDEQLDPWDLDRLRIPAGSIAGRRPSARPPRHRAGESFLKGPIPYPWMATACRLPGAGLYVATALRFVCDRHRGENRWGTDALAEGLGVAERTARRAVHAAEEAGLLAVTREPGCKLSACVLVVPEAGEPARPLRGPIPWEWWLSAARLPGPALHVATACWLTAGWSDARRFELALGAWAGLGLTRQTAARGLDALASAHLAAVSARQGRSPIVELREVPASR